MRRSTRDLEVEQRALPPHPARHSPQPNVLPQHHPTPVSAQPRRPPLPQQTAHSRPHAWLRSPQHIPASRPPLRRAGLLHQWRTVARRVTPPSSELGEKRRALRHLPPRCPTTRCQVFCSRAVVRRARSHPVTRHAARRLALRGGSLPASAGMGPSYCWLQSARKRIDAVQDQMPGGNRCRRARRAHNEGAPIMR